ncbi:cellulase family glycosylhydrolase [Fodinicola feengrottensis]|uniref:Cellulase family glycosylhydrolase n=2 Tax=Fodinicola feengrottensis TaxID=435914 RepID=A0ABN2G7Y8_9ACTN
MGANYVPSSGWFYSWLDFDPDAARRDFADLASIGLDHVRVFPIWPWIQPNRGLIRQRAIDDLLTVIDCAAEFDLRVAVDLLQGHLSSFDFLPSWVLTWHQASVFTDPTVRAGLADYTRTVAAAVSTRPNVFAVTLGNEVNNLWPANPTTLDATFGFTADLVAGVRAVAPRLTCLTSFYDDIWYSPTHPFSPAAAVDLGDITTVHSWTFNGVAGIDAPLGPATTTHADYLVELAAAAATTADRRVWLQEVGAAEPDIPAASAAAFAQATVDAVVDNPALCGITWWCSHDIDPALLDFPHREYDLGLFTVDHRRKPVADVLASVCAGSANRPTRLANAARRGLMCPVDPRDPQTRDQVAPGSTFHQDWVGLRKLGPVAIVPPARTSLTA